jgi:hypothetical protein
MCKDIYCKETVWKIVWERSRGRFFPMGEREREDTIALKKIRVEEAMFRLTNRMNDEELYALVIDVMLNRDKYKQNEYPFEEDDPKYADLNAYLKIVSLYYNV